MGGAAFPPSPPCPRPCPSRPPQPLAAAVQASGWLSAEKVSEEISKLLLVPLKEHYTQHHQVNSDNVTLELELVRAIGAENRKQGEGGCKVRARGGGRRGRAYGDPGTRTAHAPRAAAGGGASLARALEMRGRPDGVRLAKGALPHEPRSRACG